MTPIEQAREAIEQSDIEKLEALIASCPDLPNMRSEDNDRTLLHTIADYPGHKPKGIEMARLVIDAGANVNARFQHGQIEAVRETPLHWAASNDDVDLAELLLDAGADIDADAGVIANGTPIWNAVIFRCVNVARLLIERGAASNLMTASGAGRRDLVETYFDDHGNVTETAGALPCWDAPRPPQDDAGQRVRIRVSKRPRDHRKGPVRTRRRSGLGQPCRRILISTGEDRRSQDCHGLDESPRPRARRRMNPDAPSLVFLGDDCRGGSYVLRIRLAAGDAWWTSLPARLRAEFDI